MQQAHQQVDAEIQRLIIEYGQQQAQNDAELARMGDETAARNLEAAQMAVRDLSQFTGTLAPSVATDVAAETQRTGQLAQNTEMNVRGTAKSLGMAHQQGLQRQRGASGGIYQAGVSQAGTSLQEALAQASMGKAEALAGAEERDYQRALDAYRMMIDERDRAEARAMEEDEAATEQRQAREEAQREANQIAVQSVQNIIDNGGNTNRARRDLDRWIRANAPMFAEDGVDVDEIRDYVYDTMGWMRDIEKRVPRPGERQPGSRSGSGRRNPPRRSAGESRAIALYGEDYRNNPAWQREQRNR
jgi:hypothetical protein